MFGVVLLSPGSWDSGALNLKTRVPLGPGLEPSLRLPPLRAPRHPYFGTPASAYQPSRLVLHSLFLCSPLDVSAHFVEDYLTFRLFKGAPPSALPPASARAPPAALSRSGLVSAVRSSLVH